MKIHAVCCCCILLLVLISGGHHVTVEARGHSDRRREYKLLVFGDSFADTGNRAPATSDKTSASRMWYYPYGSSDSAHGNRATGRLSDGLVQSDFLARIVGLNECPSPYRVWDRNAEFSGVNFAVAGAGALDDGSRVVPSLSQQINQLRRLVDAGDIDDSDLDDSVALIAIDGPKDYVSVNETTSANQIGALSQDVTDEIVDGVRRLQRLGVSKVLVNNLPPIGCQPWRSLSTGYNSCDNKGDMISIMHNTALTQKLNNRSNRGGVLVLDLYAVFNNLLANSGFRQNNRPLLAPCCDTADPMGYCGQEDNWGRRLYSVCPTPDQTFYWDYVHPTQAAWRAIMNQLQGPIQDFLGI